MYSEWYEQFTKATPKATTNEDNVKGRTFETTDYLPASRFFCTSNCWPSSTLRAPSQERSHPDIGNCRRDFFHLGDFIEFASRLHGFPRE
jgi:hypothetical protein